MLKPSSTNRCASPDAVAPGVDCVRLRNRSNNRGSKRIDNGVLTPPSLHWCSATSRLRYTGRNGKQCHGSGPPLATAEEPGSTPALAHLRYRAVCSMTFAAPDNVVLTRL